MYFGRFDEPLVVLAPHGGTQVISSARQAADYLGSCWPIPGESGQAARRMCISVIKGLLHPKLAQRAFDRAVREAGRLPEGRPHPHTAQLTVA